MIDTIEIKISNRWSLSLTRTETGHWGISDNAEYSLFNNPLAVGTTPGQALDNFLSVEQNLLNSL